MGCVKVDGDGQGVKGERGQRGGALGCYFWGALMSVLASLQLVSQTNRVADGASVWVM